MHSKKKKEEEKNKKKELTLWKIIQTAKVKSTDFIESNALDQMISNNTVIFKLCKSRHRIELPLKYLYKFWNECVLRVFLNKTRDQW